ncbi:PAS domain S-box protein [Woeseia oceani]|uniref:PAS domain S-box protein n=1 Tax=Woeseia oceani TaxID=1548547 RepID=A0A193LJE2_9GAMM|nr:PAS domain S-box protein [Woeseia oceani]ANO52632.1 hypothetical protein BA177_16855 [Woeseia oceani]
MPTDRKSAVRDETERISALHRYALLDTAPEQNFEDIVRLATELCHMPTAMISLTDTDRQWFKSRVNFELSEISRDISFCTHAIESDGVMEVCDTRADTRFAENPLVTGPPHIRYYAGAPLITQDGHKLGCLCVVDQKPRKMAAQQQASLQALARQVITQIELRHSVLEAKKADAARQLSQTFMRATIDCLNDHIAIIDKHGEIIYVNRAWSGFASATKNENLTLISGNAPGVNYLQVCESALAAGIDEAQHVLNALRQIAGGDRHLQVTLDYPCAGPDGLRWFNVQVSAFGAGADIHAVVAYRDISREREARTGLQALNESLERRIEERTADLHLASTTLRDSEERFRSMFEGASVASIILDTNARLTEVNPAFSSMTGTSLKAASGLAIEQFVDPADWADVDSALRRISTGQLPGCELEFRCKTNEGHQWVLASLSAVKGADNKVSQIVAFLQSRSAQREAEYQRDNFFNLSIDMLLVARADGRIVRANPACEKILGYTPEQMTQKSLPDLVAPEDRDAGELGRAAMLKGDSLVLFDLHCLAANGEIKDIRWNASPWVEEGLVLAVGRDVTRIRAAERNLKLHDKMLTRAEKMASMGSWNWQVHDDRLIVSTGLRRIAGIGPAEPVQCLDDLLRAVEKRDRGMAEATIRAVITDGASRIVRCRIRRADHTVRTVQMYNDVVRDADGNAVGVSGACLDVTELHETLDRVRRSEASLRTLTMRLEDIRDDERATISREIHDELGQMLTALKIDIALLERAAVNERKPLPSRRKLSRALKSMEQLTDKTIDSVRRIARQLRPDGLDEVGLLPALEWHIKEFEKRTGIRCSFGYPQQQPEFDARTRSTLYRIAQEAMTNTARHAGADRIDIQLRTDNGQVELSICDNGCGMDAGIVDGIRSIGILGMRERAAMAGGSFEIGNNGERGTRVSVSVPLAGHTMTSGGDV